MMPAARVQAAIELLDAIAIAARDAGPAADTLIADYFKNRRYAGSADRRVIRELVYTVVRAIGERPESGRAAMLGYARRADPSLLAHFGAGPHAPAPVGEEEPAPAPMLAPAWLMTKLEARFGAAAEAEVRALLGRAPLDLRVNRLKARPQQVVALLPQARPLPQLPDGLRVEGSFRIDAHPLYREGLVEVQDAGSQRVVAACGAQPGMTVVDLCAGSGGKTLALAAAMENRGRVVAADTDRARLSRLAPRRQRAGAAIIETRLLDAGREEAMLGDLEKAADLVLVDAPCSGAGTWRRNPEARWRLTPERLRRLVALQGRLLDLGAKLVKPGGRLAYVVCSLLPEECEGVVEAFIDRSRGWEALGVAPCGVEPEGPMLLTPRRDGTDGFFMSLLTPIFRDRHD